MHFGRRSRTVGEALVQVVDRQLQVLLPIAFWFGSWLRRRVGTVECLFDFSRA